MKTLLIFVVLMALLIIPANAANITITAEPLGGTLNLLPSHQSSYTVDVSTLQRNAIQRISVDVPTGSTVSYTLWYGNGSTLSGQMIYNRVSSTFCGDPTGLVGYCQFSEVSIGSSVSNHYYIGKEETGRIDLVGYGRNEDTRQRLFIIYDSTAGVYIPDSAYTPLAHSLGFAGDAMAYTPVLEGVIYKFTVSSNQPLTGVAYYTNTRDSVQKASVTSLLDVATGWANLLIQIWETVVAVFWFFYYVIEFTWDNIYLIVALYFALTGAMAANQSSDIFAALKKWFGYQRTLLEFFLGIWDKIIGWATKIIK